LRDHSIRTIKNRLIANLPGAEYLVISPGRINLLGGHVDYNSGVVLPAAIDRYVTMAIKPRNDDRVILRALDLDDSAEFLLTDVDKKCDLRGSMLPDWALYPAVVAWAFQSKGFMPGGMEAVYASTLPIGAGLSSSAAVELAFAEYWKTAGGWNIDRMRMAEICQYAENEYVGVNCGLMDQFACAHGVARHALFFDTRSREWQPLPLPMKTTIVIADSTIQRSLSASEYNRRREECQTALSLIQKEKAKVLSLRDVPIVDLSDIAKFLPALLMKRVKHVVMEIERVKKACRCLVEDDTVGFGQMMVDGHASLRDLYEVSIPELDALVEIASNLDGCYGARLTGAGFGGCTVNLVESSQAEEFIRQLIESYRIRCGLIAKVFACKPSRSVYIEKAG